ncbi:uncharacterized protein LOC114282388 [Camellia sinensis]|uniref:uncharacterized protein LOC114282388 n=1 Tax=Camellia sinensis TaxID=4442 RepID=UPI001035C047|nr:uncharacterized protein LOC114282388 [Camellia sinensis]
MKAEMLAIVSHERSTNHNKQLPDALSGHCEPTDYDVDENPHTPPPNDEDVIKVSLESSVIPRVQLAEGLLISVDLLCEIDGVPIGPEYCKVFVLKTTKPNVVLETTSRCLRTVGETMGRYIVWRSIHVYVTILFIYLLK